MITLQRLAVVAVTAIAAATPLGIMLVVTQVRDATCARLFHMRNHEAHCAMQLARAYFTCEIMKPIVITARNMIPFLKFARERGNTRRHLACIGNYLYI